MATSPGIAISLHTTFALGTALSGFLIVTVLTFMSVCLACKGRRLKSHGPNNIRNQAASRTNPYSETCSSVWPNGATRSTVEPVYIESHGSTYPSAPQLKTTVSSVVMVNPDHCVSSLPSSAMELCGGPNAHNTDTMRAVRVYDVLTPKNIQDDVLHNSSSPWGSNEGGRNSVSDRSSFLTSSFKTSHRSVTTTSSPTPVRSYSDSYRKPANDPVYCEHLEPSMLLEKAAAQDTSTQPLPFAPLYDRPKPLKQNEQPITITKDQIIEFHDLGVGQFGRVVLAGTKGLSPKDLRLGQSTDRSRSLLVAIKRLRHNADESLRKSFECEIKFMSRLMHSNVVRLLGVCQGAEPFLVMEYMENGDLHSFLSKHKVVPDAADHINENEVTPLILMYVAVQIANGMRYLASRKFVHRDLATRNCLVGRDFVVKVSDFGMSCSLYQSFYYLVQGRLILPIRWMAFESFYGKFSVKSDVWSYGVTVWEIFTLARNEPYSELSDEEVITDAIKGAGRQLLPKPSMCTKELYDIMLRCWVHEPVIRADFEEIYSRMFLLYTRMSECVA